MSTVCRIMQKQGYQNNKQTSLGSQILWVWVPSMGTGTGTRTGTRVRVRVPSWAEIWVRVLVPRYGYNEMGMGTSTGTKPC